MPRPGAYTSNAERQTAYHARHRDRELPTRNYLAALARSLHGELERAVQAGCCPWPSDLRCRREDDTLRKLIRYLHAHTEDAERNAREGSPQ